MVSSNISKVALYVPSLRGGGVERMMVNLARGLSDRGLSIDLVLAQAEGPYLSKVPPGVRIVDLSAKRVLKSLPALVRYLRHERPDAMISAMDHVNVVAIWAIWLARVSIPLVVSVHTTISRASKKTRSIRSSFMHIFIRKFYRYANKVIIVSESAKEDFLLHTKLDPKLVKVIYNPVVIPELFEKAKMPVHHPWFAQDQPPVILGVGRLTRAKDFSTLIRAFALVREQCPTRLLIIGEGDERSKLEDLAKDLCVNEDVDLHGFVENPYAYMSHSAVFVLSSAWEGLPTVLIEALAIGTPVVSTDCPSGPSEILDHGKYGRLVPTGDVKGLASAICETLRSGFRSEQVGRHLRKFSLDEVVTQYLNILTGRE